MGWKVFLELVLAVGCHSNAATTMPTPHASTTPAPCLASARAVSFQCAHEAVAGVDPLVDHFAGLGGEMWDQLYGKKPEFKPPPSMDKAAFVSFVATAEGKDWLRRTGLFDPWYYGFLQQCEARGGSWGGSYGGT